MTTPPEPSPAENAPVGSSPVESSPGIDTRDISVAEMTPQATTAHPTAGHETTDVQVPLILKLLSALLVVVIISALGLERLAAYYERAAKRADPPRSPMAESQTPPLPRLEPLPRDALAEFRAAEEARLKEYRWVDRNKQTVEIPIKRAMQILAERGIPAPAGSAPSGTGAATEGAKPAATDSKEGPR